MTSTQIQTIPLNQLQLSASNVRKATERKQPLAELKASIKAHGLLENLIVRTIPNAAGETQHFVIAGSLRLKALQELVNEGALIHDLPIPCRLLTQDDKAEEISLAENTARFAMHPADQVEAFANLIQSGSTITQIASRFGVSKRTVTQRLRLGSVAPIILEDLRTDKIDLDCVMAFTLTPDHEHQIAAYKEIAKTKELTVYTIKKVLTQEKIPATSTLVKYVGKEAYKAAGGTITEDLFADQYEDGTWLNDPKILHDLAHQKLSKAAKKFHTQDWKWLEIQPLIDWNERHNLGQMKRTPDALTPEEEKSKKELTDKLAVINTNPDQTYTDTYEIESALRQIQSDATERGTYSPEQMAISGVIVTLNHAGKLEILTGQIKPEDKKAATKLDPTSIPPIVTTTPDAIRNKQLGINNNMTEDLSDLRNNIVKSHLATHFSLAFDLATFQFARSILNPAYEKDPLEIQLTGTASCPTNRLQDKTFHAADTGSRRLAELWKTLSKNWLETEDLNEAFEHFQALPIEAKQALFAASIAHTLNPQLSIQTNRLNSIEQVIHILQIDFAKEFRPSAEQYWKQIPKAKIIEIAQEVLGKQWANSMAKAKKGALIKAMEEAFAANDEVPTGLTSEQRSKALAWTPPGFIAKPE